MTAMRKIWATRVNNTTAAEYVGHKGTIFFDELTGALRISDGVTVGGQPLTLVASDFAFQFGDFVATTPEGFDNGATLSSLNPNQNINIVSNGTGDINVVGDFHVHPTSLGGLESNPIFSILGDGQVKMLVPGADSTAGAVELVGSLDGIFQEPVNIGVMLHVTGIAPQSGIGVPSRIYNDAQAGYSGWVARRYNGTAIAPTKVLADEEIGRFVGNAYTGGGWKATGAARLSIVANETQENTAQGGRFEMWACPNGSTTQTLVAKIDVADGITANLKGNVTGNVVATTVTATNLIGALSPSSQLGITSVGTLTNLTVANTVTSNYISGKLIRGVRDAGTIGAGGTLTIDFTTDSIVKCVWGDGMTLAYQNFLPGRIVKIIATKATGSGTDSLSLDGVTGAQTSTGGTTVTANADTTVFIECISTNSSLAGLFIKL